jgi:hypothetical protein
MPSAAASQVHLQRPIMFSRSTTPNGNDREDTDASQARPEKNNPLLRLLARLSEDPYRPEKHYMRGPGPKAKAKALLTGAVKGGAIPKQINSGK